MQISELMKTKMEVQYFEDMIMQEMRKCVNLVLQSKAIQNIDDSIEVQALYNYNFSTEESEKTEGHGLCAILAQHR